MTVPAFGLQFIREDDSPLPIIGANLDVVGIIGPCSTADPTTFPENQPVLVFSNDSTTLSKLGADGYIADAVNAINSQLATAQAAVQLVIVITPYGTNADANIKLQETIANIMGNSIAQTGVWAFLLAPNTLYCTPRLITAPGYTGQMANSLDTLDVTTNGVGYTPNQTYELTFAAGGGETNGATLVLPTGHAVADAHGNIAEPQVFIDSYGAWMTVAPTVTAPSPDGPPIVAEPATGQMLFQRTPGVGATINLNGSVVTFVASGATGNQVNIAADLDLPTTLANLATFLNGSSDANIVENTYTVTGGTLTITQKATGTAGNAFTLSTTVVGATLSGATLSGGVNAAAAVRAGITATIALGANPVVAALSGGVLDTLYAHAVVESAGTSMVADEEWRNTIDDQRIIALSGGVKVLNALGEIVVMPWAPREIGLMVARDFATGYPFHCAANVAVNGIVGPSRAINFTLTDPACEGQQLLVANIGIIARGEVGVESAISNGGFIAIATDTCASDPLWKFYNVSRGRDYIELTLMPMLRTYLGNNNITAQTIAAVLRQIGVLLGSLTAAGQILGFNTQFIGGLNSAAAIRAGRIVVNFAAEEPPPLVEITTYSARYAPAIDAMVAQLATQLNTVGQAQAA